MTLRWAVLPLAAAAVLTIAACDVGLDVGRSTAEDDKTEQAAVTEIRIDGGGGDVAVQPGAAGQAQIHRKIRYADDKKPSGSTYRIDGGVLYLNTDCGRRCDVSYDVRVPEGVKVTGENDSGDVRLTGVSTVDISLDSGSVSVTRATGPVRVKVDSGEARLADIAADLTARSDSGTIRAANVRAASTELKTDSGEIALSLASAGNVTAEADSGTIAVQVPSKAGYRVDARTESGDAKLEVPNDPNGTHHLKLRADSGEISLTAQTAG